MKDFKQLKIWQMGIKIVVDSYRLVEGFPQSERFGLTDQITRAAVSIPSNIAEGSSRGSEKDYKRFLEIALGSSFELETHIVIAHQLNFGSESLKNQILQDLDQQQKMLTAFIRTLNR